MPAGLLERHGLSPDSDATAHRMLLMLTARAHVCGPRMDEEFQALDEILRRYAALAAELRSLGL